MLEEIIRFTGRSTGLKLVECAHSIEITQTTDARNLKIDLTDLESVLPRQDQDGRPFLQLNLREGKKILLTDQLVGFKPKVTPGLDLKKLPRVVTTPDLISVLEALEETLSLPDSSNSEAEMLKKAYFAIVMGAETVGFQMESEKHWVVRLLASGHQKSA